MNTAYILYDSMGRISIKGNCPESMVQAQDGLQGLGVLVGTGNMETDYVDITLDPPEIKPRLPFPGTQNKTSILADGLDEWIVSSLPVGSVVTWPDGEVTTINDGTLEFTVDLAGTYTFKFDPFPYLEEEVSVEAIT